MRSSLVCGLTLWIAASAVAQPHVGDEPPAPPALLKILEQRRPGGSKFDRGLEQRLVDLGSAHLQTLFDALGPESCLEPKYRKVVERAIARLDRAAVFAHVRRVAANEPTMDARLLCLHLVGVTGGAGSWAVALDLVGGIDERSMRSPAVAGSVRNAFARTAETDASVDGRLEGDWRSLHTEARAALTRAFAEAGTRRSLARLVRLLDVDAEARRSVLVAIASVPVRSLARLDDRSRLIIRRCLEQGDPATRSAAADVTARVHDPAAFDQLLGALEDDDPLVRRSALRALRTLTGVPIGPDVGRWRAWREQESRWEETRLEKEIRLLDAESPATIVGVLRSLGQHRLCRDAFVTDLESPLRHESAAVRETACRTLAALGAPTMAESCLPLLDDDVPAVRAAARAALVAMTGLRVRGDSRAWRATLRRR